MVKIEFCAFLVWYTCIRFKLMFLFLFCDYRKDFVGSKIKNVATKNRFPTTIFNWFKNVAYAFKDAKRFATPMNLCKFCDLIPSDFSIWIVTNFELILRKFQQMLIVGIRSILMQISRFPRNRKQYFCYNWFLHLIEMIDPKIAKMSWF